MKLFQRWLYRNYWISSSAAHWFSRRFTPGGLLLFTTMLICGAIGLDTNQNLAYQAFALLGCIALVSAILSGFPAPLLQIKRKLPRYGTAGQPLQYKIVVTNPSSRQQHSISLIEQFGDPRPSLAEFLQIPEPGEKTRNQVDRRFGYFRWRWLVARKEMARTKIREIPSLAPQSDTEVPVDLMPFKRGKLRFTAISISVPDPFGLVRRHREVVSEEQVLILPKRYPVEHLELPGKMQYQAGGVSLATAVGQAEEFIALRDYRRGDPLRHIHWKSLGRTGKLIVKEYQDEYFVRHALLLDTFLDLPDAELFEEAVSVAASFATVIPNQESLFDLMFVGPQAYCFTSGRNVGQVEEMLEILASVQPCTTSSFETLSILIRRHAAQISGCVCVFLRWDDERIELIKKLRSMGVPCDVYVVTRNPASIRASSTFDSSIHLLEAGRIEQSLKLGFSDQSKSGQNPGERLAA
jgi:uncharacterized protein (DUF58 family)